MLVSGGGTNLQALLDACRRPGYGAEVVAVGADRDGIEGLARAERRGRADLRRAGRATTPTREAWDEALTEASPRTSPTWWCWPGS